MPEKKINIYQSFLIILLLSSQAFSCLATNYNAEFDDWIVSPSCKNRTANLCHG